MRRCIACVKCFGCCYMTVIPLTKMSSQQKASAWRVNSYLPTRTERNRQHENASLMPFLGSVTHSFILLLYWIPGLRHIEGLPLQQYATCDANVSSTQFSHSSSHHKRYVYFSAGFDFILNILARCWLMFNMAVHFYRAEVAKCYFIRGKG